MNNVKVGYIRPSLLDDLGFSLLSQEKVLKDAGCNAFVNDPNFKLDFRKSAVERLQKLGFFDICDKAGPGTKLFATDASRIVRNYSEIPALLQELTIHECTLIIIRDNFTRRELLNFVLKMNKVSDITKKECIKVGQQIYSSRGGRYGPNFIRPIKLAHEIAGELQNKTLVSDVALKYDVAASWIYLKGLNLDKVQRFYENLTKAQIESNNIDIHNEVNKLVLIARKDKKRNKTKS